MAKEPQDDEKRKKSKGASVVVWVLMAMLVVGLGGFGVTNFGGNINAIGRVGDREIAVTDYARALQQELNAFSAQVGQPINLQQAQTFGLDRQVRQQLINTAALDNETARVGISAGDARVAAEITGMQAFQDPTGKFNRDTYRFALQNNNLAEGEFESRLREDLSRALLQGAITGGFVGPHILTDTLYAYISERRGFSLLRLSMADLPTPPADLTDAELLAYHTDNIAQFTKPEARRVTYAALLPEMIAADMQIDPDTLSRAYDERKADFIQPERRLVERLVFPTVEAATDAKARIDAGGNFETLAAERGVSLDDIDLGDVGQAELGPDAGPAVFALTDPGVVGPFTSDLGPALFRMNAILAAQNTTLEQATPDLTTELSMDAARRAIDDQIDDLDDRLAGGETLEELIVGTKMQLATMDYVGASDDQMTGYPEFRKAAEEVENGDFPEIVRLKDGGIFALRLDEIVPPAPIPFEEARDAVTVAWRTAATAKALSDQAIALKAQVESGSSLGSLGIVDVTPTISRSGTIEETPPALITAIFDMEAGQVRVIEDAGFVALVQLDTVTPGAVDGKDAEALKAAIAAQAQQGIAQDAFALFTNAMTQNGGIYLDDTAINAVHAQFR